MSPRRRYLVGVSGGRDSVVLLDFLARLGFRDLVVCHLNHGLRGRAAGQDAAFVRRVAVRAGFRCAVEKADVAARGREAGVSAEAAGRAARHAFFAAVARRERCRRVVLAHHADDQAETVLMHVLRGAGTRGLAGMREVSHLGVGRARLEIWRPLLGIWRAEIDAEAARLGLRFREDASNHGLAPTRNRIRHSVLPFLTDAMGRDVRGALVRLAESAAADEDVLADAAAEAGRDLAGPGGTLVTARLLALPVGLQRRVLRRWLRKDHKVPDLGFDEVETVRAIAAPDSPAARVMLPAATLVCRRRGHLEIRPP